MEKIPVLFAEVFGPNGEYCDYQFEDFTSWGFTCGESYGTDDNGLTMYDDIEIVTEYRYGTHTFKLTNATHQTDDDNCGIFFGTEGMVKIREGAEDAKGYPREFNSMADVFRAYKNFPRKYWEPDFQDLVSRTQGLIVVGAKADQKDNDGEYLVFAMGEAELNDVLANSDNWKNLHPVEVDLDGDWYEFDYDKTRYVARQGTLPYTVNTWLDIDWVMNKLYGLDKIKDMLDKHEKEIAEATKDVVWVNDEGKVVDENDRVIETGGEEDKASQ